MIAVALVLGVGVLVAGIVLAAAVRLLPTLRLQVAALALLAVCVPLGVVLASGRPVDRSPRRRRRCLPATRGDRSAAYSSWRW